MIVFAPLATVVILSALKLVFGSLRPTDEEEVEGLDFSQHSETAYSGIGGGSAVIKGMHMSSAASVQSSAVAATQGAGGVR